MNTFESCSYLGDTLPSTRNKRLLTCSASSMTSILAAAFLGGSKTQRSTCWYSAKRKLLPCSVSWQFSTTGKEVWACHVWVSVCVCVSVNALANYLKTGYVYAESPFSHRKEQRALFATESTQCVAVFLSYGWNIVRFPTRSPQSRTRGPKHLNLMRSQFLWLTETLVSLQYLFGLAVLGCRPKK